MANKNDLIEKVQSEVTAHQGTELTKKEATIAVDAVIKGIVEALKAGENVKIVDLGTFTVKDRAERKGRNPKTGEEITIPAKRVPSFKANSAFKAHFE